MPYEISNITESNAAIPDQAPLAQMREDRIVDPYAHARPRIAPPAPLKAIAIPSVIAQPTGQVGINRDPSLAGEETLGTPEESVTLSPQVAALARKEQKFRQKELEIKKREEALEAERAELAGLRSMKAKLEAKDYSGLDGLVKYDEYTNYLIEKETALTPEQQQLKKHAEEIEGIKAQHLDETKKRFEAAVNERRNAVKELVETKPEFARIKKAKMEEAVVKHILDTWEHENIDLSPEQATKEVADILLEKANEWKALLEDDQPKVEAPQESDQKQLPPLKPGIKTLTNNMAATGEIKRPVKSFQFMTDSERYAEARRRAEEKLKALPPR